MKTKQCLAKRKLLSRVKSATVTIQTVYQGETLISITVTFIYMFQDTRKYYSLNDYTYYLHFLNLYRTQQC